MMFMGYTILFRVWGLWGYMTKVKVELGSPTLVDLTKFALTGKISEMILPGSLWEWFHHVVLLLCEFHIV